jgi:hypothetical protein
MKDNAKENLRKIKIEIENQRKEDDSTQMRELLKEKEKKYIEFRVNSKDYQSATKKINFAMIMFMSFPQIRENYLKLNSKRPITIEDYLKNVSKNIRK